MLDIIREKVANAERISDEEGLFLLSEAELLDLAPLAQEWRWRHNPEPIVTFVVDTNLNYTNVCNAYCGFCAFYRPSADDPSAYTLSVEQILQKIERASGQGVTTVLMQGGLNDDLDMDYYVELVRQTRERFPHITPHYFSAPEIMEMTKVSGKSIAEVISVLREAGQRTMPGGGSEILADGVKAQVSKLWPKAAVSDWTDVHREAHRQGWMTTATMMYGHVERDEDIVESLRHIREVQDDAADQPGGFTAFIPWSFKKQNTALAPKVADEAGANRDFNAIHHNREVAKNGGAPDMYANNSFLQGMWERTVREYIGLDGAIRKIGPFRMRNFNPIADTVIVKGKVTKKFQEGGKNFVELEMQSVSDKTGNVSVGPGPVLVTLPSKN